MPTKISNENHGASEFLSMSNVRSTLKNIPQIYHQLFLHFNINSYKLYRALHVNLNEVLAVYNIPIKVS